VKPLVVLGDALLDRDLDGRVDRLCPDAPVPVVDDPQGLARPGGAALAALLAAEGSRSVVLITAVGDDTAGRELGTLLDRAGVELVDLGLQGRTGEKVRIRTAGRSLLRLDYGGPGGPVGTLTPGAGSALAAAGAVLVSDYGRGITSEPSVRHRLADLVGRTPVVWDPHPRGADPVPGVRLATPNRAEAEAFTRDLPAGTGLRGVTGRARALLARWRAAGVAVTTGAQGAVLVAGDGSPLVVPAPVVHGGDPCGAGDRFAAAAATCLADGGLVSEAVVDAVTVAAQFVAAGGAGALHLETDADAVAAAPYPRSAQEVVQATRAAGGTVVATGGCFDLLHAGHVRTLQAARRLGDCLIVCVNDDASVRRLKGPDRPLVAQADRVAVLEGLGCVDAVTLFGEDTPEAILDRLRPDIWAKGADYAVADLPEAALVASWGGEAVVLPYLAGRSTSQLIQEATRRAP